MATVDRPVTGDWWLVVESIHLVSVERRGGRRFAETTLFRFENLAPLVCKRGLQQLAISNNNNNNRKDV